MEGAKLSGVIPGYVRIRIKRQGKEALFEDFVPWCYVLSGGGMGGGGSGILEIEPFIRHSVGLEVCLHTLKSRRVGVRRFVSVFYLITNPLCH